MTPTQTLLPTYRQMLRALSNWLNKTDGSEAILSARLAPDMFPLSTQIRFCCVQAYEAVARLRAEPLPPICHELFEEGRNGGETPGSIREAQARIEDTLAFLDALSPTELDDRATEALVLELPNGVTFDMTGEDYVRDWALPQFYFHLMTAYSLLRREGVALGKADYVQHALAYMRTPDSP
ncbi:MAG: DUF1993 domain-containing protein [Pseudomonadota bacterium]